MVATPRPRLCQATPATVSSPMSKLKHATTATTEHQSDRKLSDIRLSFYRKNALRAQCISPTINNSNKSVWTLWSHLSVCNGKCQSLPPPCCMGRCVSDWCPAPAPPPTQPHFLMGGKQKPGQLISLITGVITPRPATALPYIW